MLALVLALPLALAVQVAPVPAASDPTPDQRRAALAGMTFLECAEMMAAQPTRAAFTAEVRQLAASAGGGVDFTTSGVRLDDDGGRGCRVSFTAVAAAADPVADAMRKFQPGGTVVTVTPAPGGETVTGILTDPRP